MTTDKLPTRTVSAEVVGHKMHNGKPITELEIPEWNSKYPTVIYGVSEQHQTQLPMGETVVVMLKADRIKDGTDGSKPWHFFWSIQQIGGDLPAAGAGAAQAVGRSAGLERGRESSRSALSAAHRHRHRDPAGGRAQGSGRLGTG